MNKKWGFIEKILSGHKTIESRWYKFKRSPWGNISEGDTVYFKNAGEGVTAMADVAKVLSWSDLVPEKVEEILQEYGERIGIEPKDSEKFANYFRDKKYCLLVFLCNANQVSTFAINKKGYGNMASWISCEDVSLVKI